MKKVFWVLSVIAIALVIAIGCETSQEPCSPQPTAKECNKPNEQPTDENAFEQVRMEIANLNLQYVDKSPKGRGWRKARRVMFADMYGALSGYIHSRGIFGSFFSFFYGLFCSVRSSIDAARVDSGGMQLVPQLQNPQFEVITLNNAADSLGFLHNVIITDLFDRYGNNLRTMYRSELNNLIIGEINKYREAPETLGDLEAVYQDAKPVIDLYDENTLDPAINKAIELNPELENELLVIKSFCETVDDLAEEVREAEYTKSFCQIIESSELTEESKFIINAGVSVNVSSTNLWVEEEEAAPIIP